MLLPEPLAYPYSALCLFLIVKALSTRSAWWIAGAALASAVAPLVKSQLGVVPAVYVLAVLGLAWNGRWMRRWRERWTTWDRVGAITLLAGVAIVVNSVITHQSFSWYVATTLWKDRMIDDGLWAVGAFTIGVGVFPVVAGLAALVRPRGVVRSERERAFVAVAVSAIGAFTWYTAVKAAYISTVFSTLTEERNLIYLSPVVFAATALALERRRLRLLPVLAAAALAGYVLVGTNYKMDVHLYNDAPGLAILQSANRNLGLTPHGAQIVLLALLGASVAVLLAPRVRRVPPVAVRAIVLTAALFVLAWNVTGQMAAASASRNFSDELLHNYPRPLNWLDQADHGQPAMYLGQEITDANGLWLLEFWNKSLHYVWSLDGTAKGPGPTLSPDLLSLDGQITTVPGIQYVVVDPGIDLVGGAKATAVHRGGGAAQRWRLYKITPPLRLADAVGGIYADGWAGKESSYSRYRTPGDRPGSVVVNISRAAWNGPSPTGHVTIRVGPLGIKDKQPALASVTQIRRWKVESGLERSFVIPTPKPPFRVEVLISPTFVPAREDPRSSELREFGAQVSFGFQPG